LARRRAILAAIGLSLSISAASGHAGDYRSSFGFAISVPDVWLVLTRDEVMRRSELFAGDLAALPDSMLRTVFERVRAGELEIFYRREGGFDDFVDNVNIMHQSSPLPGDVNELHHLCRLLPVEFSRLFGRPISMDACEIRERSSRPALYLQFDGAVPGTTTLQYQLARATGSTLVITATASRPNLPRLLGEFEEMVSSIRIE